MPGIPGGPSAAATCVAGGPPRTCHASPRCAPQLVPRRRISSRPSAGVVRNCYMCCMNENFGEMKIRVRKLDEMLLADPGLIHGRLDFAAAVSRARRLLRDGDRSREPSAVLRAAVEKAELLGRGIP